MANDSTTRFSNRVEDYVKYRPGYPEAVVDYLQDKYGIAPPALVADIGAGTGISSQLFLDKGYTVIAVEPNKEMRDKSVALLQHYKNFSALPGTAEQTGLTDRQVDMIVAGQAFHWFNNKDTKKEFERVLKPDGILALIWNERLTDSPFAKEYDELIVKHARDYTTIDHRNIDAAAVQAFFSPYTCELKVFPNYQEFDFTGLKGRLLSSSYMPMTGESGYGEMLADLVVHFEKYQQGGYVRIVYDTKVYSGRF